MLKAFRYRLCPTKAQEAALNEQLRLCRTLYNAALEERKAAYKKARKTLTGYDQMKHLSEIKAELPEYKGVYSQVLQDVLKRLDKAFQAFFRRLKAGQTPGYPRFQGRDRYDSICYPQSGFSVSEKTAFFSKIGNIRIRLHRPLEGKIKTATITRDCGEWYVSYVCEVEPRPLPVSGSSVGVDVGTTWFAITSDGEFVENPRHFQGAMKKLRVAQRSVSRKTNKRSNRRRKAVRRVAKLQRKVARQRLDFHHKTAIKLIRENDLIAHEDLNVGGLGRGTLARSIHDVGWGQFFSLLSQKAAWAARKVVAVDPRYTSQACHQCGHTCRENRVSQSRFWCVACDHQENADLNAARNILGRAVPSGINVAVVNASVA
ncbi:RNA-guided endonuclease InsQ/TnpB family protein [Deinococcus radiopugnans]|uniref:Transposase n=1 Tax=Deinococcus radiopugnans ATCC 19172 TaxID=585398 RepID=A0A5C4XUR1_9DEIO|nr:RNA-guided endonuclease TnpB family protein [Deinococcus radiopugnans]MBB6018719.1 putative transposase [Deinococcus radiopugnans ATCC 19172]TNM66923.1 IS200/IS605 family element transposase accessory protein TnpB [Deinococcus radiopugnans ATCC 19172]